MNNGRGMRTHKKTYVLMFLCLKKLLTLFYHPVEPYIQQRPERDIRQQHQRVVHVADGHHGKHEEACRHQLDGHHGPAGRETHRQKLMMDVRLVRQEQRLPVARTPQHHPHHVQTRHQQHTERHQQRVVLQRRQHHRVVHAIAHHEETQDEAQRQAPRVAHENLAPHLRPSEHIVREERNDHPHRHESQHGIYPLVQLHEEHPEHQQRHHAQPRRQSVDAVNQVHRVCDEHREQHCQRNAHRRRNHAQTEKPVEVVDVQARQRNHRRRQNLNHELPPVAHPHQVVTDAHDIQQREAAHQKHELAGHPLHVHLVRTVARHHPQRREHTHREQDDREERHSPQPRHRPFVHLARVGHVEQAFPH